MTEPTNLHPVDDDEGQPQHLEALLKAQATRRRRREIRELVGSRYLSIAALLRRDGIDPDDAARIGTLPVGTALRWGWRIGDVVALKIMAKADLIASVGLQLQDLSDRRLERLIAVTEQMAPHACSGESDYRAALARFEHDQAHPAALSAAA